ncbi:MAG: hypothetical protein U0174_19495 [Polyangiaceae bacterium]
MNKLDMCLILVGFVGTLGLPGCASKDATGEESTAAAGGELSRSTTGGGRVMTEEEFLRGGGQPLRSGGDTPGDGTTLYGCPKLVLTPSATMTRASEYMSFNAGQPDYIMPTVDDVRVGQNRSQFTYTKMVGSWFSVNEFVCGVGIDVQGAALWGTASVTYKKSFSPEKLCQPYVAQGEVHFSLLCKDAPSPI